MNKELSLQILLLIAPICSAAPQSDCIAGNADSTCARIVERATMHLPPPTDLLYDGPIAGAPLTGAGYWGYDFLSASSGLPSSVPRDMYINRSQSAISLTFTFDLPSSQCGTGCAPGMEFKLNASWDSFFPNVIISGNQAIASLQVAPGQAYGFVIALWMARNPRVKVQNLSTLGAKLSEVGLPDLSDATAVPGSYYQCMCQDGVAKTCYTGTHYANGLMGQWFRDRYAPWDAIGCN